MSDHGLTWAEANVFGMESTIDAAGVVCWTGSGAQSLVHVVECRCGATFFRRRLADAAIALERHEAAPGSYPAPAGTPRGSRRGALT